MLGVKCGCNEAFLVRAADAPIEDAMLRPVVRGETLTRWRIAERGEAIVWTHAADGCPLSVLPPRVADGSRDGGRALRPAAMRAVHVGGRSFAPRRLMIDKRASCGRIWEGRRTPPSFHRAIRSFR